MSDASFHDADQGPLMLRAEAPEDVAVLSMLVQDAVLTGADVTFDRKRRQLAMLINRFRWEDVEDAQREGRPFERVRALLGIEAIFGASLPQESRFVNAVVRAYLSLQQHGAKATVAAWAQAN